MAERYRDTGVSAADVRPCVAIVAIMVFGVFSDGPKVFVVHRPALPDDSSECSHHFYTN